MYLCSVEILISKRVDTILKIIQMKNNVSRYFRSNIISEENFCQKRCEMSHVLTDNFFYCHYLLFSYFSVNTHIAPIIFII